MDGLFLIDKPEGMSSFDVIRGLRKKFPGTKMGYLGTLDPLATGLLVIFVGMSTKLISLFEEAKKEYEASFELGKSSDTFDSTGNIVERQMKTWPTKTEVEKALVKFRGPIWQIQPPFSAVHREGKRAYELAREGKKVDLGKRQVEIFELELSSYHPPYGKLDILSSSGTYVRSLIAELGQSLGTGAVMSALRRTHVGPFRINDAVKCDDIREDQLLSAKKLFPEHVNCCCINRPCGKKADFLQ